jgi:hypothetical protein
LDFQKITIPASNLCVHGGMGSKVPYIVDYVEKNKNGGHLNTM